MKPASLPVWASALQLETDSGSITEKRRACFLDC